MLTETFRIYGQPEPPAEPIPLRAGPLAMLYDPTNGRVRRIKLGECEVLRGIYAAVRDHNWGTVSAKISETVRAVQPQSFHVEFEAEHRQGGIHFVWRGLIRGDADGTVRYELDGEAKTTFRRNRIGFCVLHPIRECAGARAKQFRVDGTEVECRFPELIEPQIVGRGSFRDLRGVAHEIAAGLWAEIEFEGDTFETEDQRNWTDASFKTYCTPLALPFPVAIKQGTPVRQAVTLRLRSRRREEADASGVYANPPPHVGGYIESVNEDPALTLTIPGTRSATLPRIGLGVASHGEPLTESEAATLRPLRPAHLRVDVRLAAKDWIATLERAAGDAAKLDAKLELALHLPREREVDLIAVTRILERHAATLVRVLALREGEPATSVATLTRVRKLLGGCRAPVGCGSDSNFCELNREQALGRAAVSESDFVFWSINPQVHACDHRSVTETLEAQAATVHSAREFAGGRPLVVSPVTLRQRFNPVATGVEPPPSPDELPSQMDPRQLSQFAAGWTLGSIAALASAGIASVTYFETTGWRGVMERAGGTPLPEKFPSSPGALFPIGQALLQLAGFRQVAAAATAAGDDLTALALFAGTRPSHLLIVNHTDVPRIVRIVAPEGPANCVPLGRYEVRRVALCEGD